MKRKRKTQRKEASFLLECRNGENVLTKEPLLLLTKTTRRSSDAGSWRHYYQQQHIVLWSTTTSPSQHQFVLHRNMYNFAALLFLALSFGALTATAAADLITSIAKAPPAATVNRRLQAECSCSPRSYTFQLNLNQTCANNTLEGKPGVNNTKCFFRGRNTNSDRINIHFWNKSRPGCNRREESVW